jgi:hypothetical protein
VWYILVQLISLNKARFKGSTFKGLGWLLVACFLLLASTDTSSQEPVTRSYEPEAETLNPEPFLTDQKGDTCGR